MRFSFFIFYLKEKKRHRSRKIKNKEALYIKNQKIKKEENTCGGIFFVIRGKMKATEVQLCLKIRDRTNLWHL